MHLSYRLFLSIAFVCFCSNSTLMGQGLAEKYFNIKFAYNPVTIKTNEGIYNVTYENDKGIFTTPYEVLSSYKINQYNIGVGFGKFKGLNHTISFEFMKGKIEKGQFGYSLGYNFALEGNKNDFLIRTALGLNYGNTSINFEEIVNKDRFINLYGERYEAESAEIMQVYSSFLVRPSVTFTYLIKQIFGISFELGYNVDLSKKSGEYQAFFTEYSDADPKLINNISDNNYKVLNQSGQLSKDNLYNLSGFYWSVGISGYRSFDYD